MTTLSNSDGVGPLLREWRRRRKLSQQELALQTEISARHLSFIETGRSRPSRALVHRLADSLEVPLRQRNTLLVAAGYSPLYQETSLDAPRLKVVREAVDRLITAHNPYPALAVDAGENILSMNRGAQLLLADVSPALLVPPVNVMRVCLHPEGLARQVVNVDEWRSHLLGRLYRQSVYSGREELRELYEEVSTYGPRSMKDCTELSDTIVASIRVRALGTELRFFSTITTFGAATDITVAELSLETMHPANAHTATVFSAAVEDQPDRKDTMSLLSRSA
ncbi:helix-turn-helix domain-containing protein [Streptomyces sp. NPDC005374]|uniref:helix-turn-helix domain-containing protein n=1 Tax=Streptomyces sp. NPDC005374 TaxID=3364713 RepID=UPI0036AB4A9A